MSLSPRQLEVARLVCDGYTNPEIADKLGIQPRTVRAHTDNIARELGAANRRMIPKRMRELGLK